MNVSAQRSLSRRGFYDGLDFHRISSGFVIQGRPVIAPASVRVSGPSALVRGLEAVVTETVDIRGVTDRFERTVPIDTAAHPMLHYTPREVTVSGRARRS